MANASFNSQVPPKPWKKSNKGRPGGGNTFKKMDQSMKPVKKGGNPFKKSSNYDSGDTGSDDSMGQC